MDLDLCKYHGTRKQTSLLTHCTNLPPYKIRPGDLVCNSGVSLGSWESTVRPSKNKRGITLQ